eukprot:UN25687
MRLADTIVYIRGCGIKQVNGKYERHPSNPRVFQRRVLTRMSVRNGRCVSVGEYIAIFIHKDQNRKFWVIQAMEALVGPLGPTEIFNRKFLYTSTSTNEEIPPIRNWQACNGVQGAIPTVQTQSRKVVVHSQEDLESAVRNYFRTYFVRESLDGRTITNIAVMDHIANAMTGKPAPVTHG